MELRVQAISLHPVGGSIPDVGNRSRRWTERHGQIVALDDGNTLGYGEASPLPGYSDESLAIVRSELHELRSLLPIPLSTERPLEPPAEVAEVLHSAASQFAFATAAIDLIGKSTGKSAAELLRGSKAPTTPITTTCLVDTESLDSATTMAAAASASGVRAIKLKIGVALDREISIIAAIRRVCPTIEIRVDANQGIPEAELAPRLAALADAGVDLIEEPCAPNTVASVATTVPIALDETLRHPDGLAIAETLADQGSLGALVIKPAVLGWLTTSMRWARVAERLSVPVIVSHLFDGPVAMAMYSELARGLSCTRPQGLSRHPALAAYPAAALPRLGETSIGPATEPGLGLGRHPW